MKTAKGKARKPISSRAKTLVGGEVPDIGDKVRIRRSKTDWDDYEVRGVSDGRALLRHHAGCGLEWRGLGNLRLIARKAWSRPKYGNIERHEEWGFSDVLHGVELFDGEMLEFVLPDGKKVRAEVNRCESMRSVPEPHNTFSYDYHCSESMADLGNGETALLGIDAKACRVNGLPPSCRKIHDWSECGA